MEPCMNKARKCTTLNNSQNLTTGCFVSKMASVKDKNFLLRVYSEYEEICKILNVWKIANMVFLVDETCTKLRFLPLGAILCCPKSIITGQILVTLILTHIILAKVLQQPILGANGLLIIMIQLLKNQKYIIKMAIFKNSRFQDFQKLRKMISAKAESLPTQSHYK